MIDTRDFACRAERELHAARRLGEATCQAWGCLHPGAKAAFASAFAFLGCQVGGGNGQPALVTEEADRIAAGRLMLVKLGLDSDDPRWSSEILGRVVKAAVEVPGGSVGDLLRAAYEVLGEYRTPLSAIVATFLKDMVVTCFSRHRSSFEAVNWREFIRGVKEDAIEAQFYLVHHAVPPQFVSPELEQTLLKRLANSPFGDEVAKALTE